MIIVSRTPVTDQKADVLNVEHLQKNVLNHKDDRKYTQ